MPMRWRSALPDVTGAEHEWVNGERTKAELEGRPTLVHFWAAGCERSREGLPIVKAWQEAYGPDADGGLRVIGVHTPRSGTDADRDADSAQAAKAEIARQGLTHPVLLDEGREAAAAFRNECVPAYYLFDREGRLRHRQVGERGLSMLERRIHKVIE